MNILVIALGGNAILKRGERGSYEEQYYNITETVSKLADIIELGYRIVITHGNGPQVGATMIRYDAAKTLVPPFPLHVAGAETQGFIGYMIQQALVNEFIKRKIDISVATVVTQVIVDRNDPAFNNPTKPIGPFYRKEELQEISRLHPDWVIIDDAGRGYRRVVPSPDPKRIVEIDVIKRLVKDDSIVIACGGGGIPVIEKEGQLIGVDAVIDKDLASERLATQLGASKMMILTDVEGVYLDYNTPHQRLLRETNLDEIKKYHAEGHFKTGSMGPKVKAIIRFLANGGSEGIIGHLEKAKENLVEGEGTHIFP